MSRVTVPIIAIIVYWKVTSHTYLKLMTTLPDLAHG